MLDRVALDGLEGAELLALNTDVRTLGSSVATEKIQLGVNLTKGLGSGGDPDLGEKAVLEAEDEVMASLRDPKIVFLCVGLGGGTGSGAAPIVTRLAREAGAFTVVFATMPFAFEGRRRREQAEESLNQLAVLSNALVTFDNGRMGELVLPKQGVHEAFAAADRMISDSINAVARLVLRPGLINVGLDELMTALETNRSRCLFGSGLAKGENRAQGALKSALNSPLLDRGTLLKEASTVLVHICGGEDLTMFEVELLMEALTKHIPEDCHLLFGAATDPAMKDELSVTIISALPEDRLKSASASDGDDSEMPDVVVSPTSAKKSAPKIIVDDKDPGEAEKDTSERESAKGQKTRDEKAKTAGAADKKPTKTPEAKKKDSGTVTEEKDNPEAEDKEDDDWLAELERDDADDDSDRPWENEEPEDADKKPETDFPEEGDGISRMEVETIEAPVKEEEHEKKSARTDDGEESGEPPAKEEKETPDGGGDELDFVDLPRNKTELPPRRDEAGKKNPPQSELELDGGPKGRFEGQEPNLVEGEDLDVPPYLRKNKRR